MYFLISRRSPAPVAGRGRPPVARFGPASGPPEFCAGTCFSRGDYLHARAALCRMEVERPNDASDCPARMNTVVVLLRCRPGPQERVVNAYDPFTPAWGSRGRDLSFFGFNLLHSDVRDIVAVAE